MKKICFLGIMLIAAHGIVSAQTSFSVNAGTGVWAPTCNPNKFDGHTICKFEVAPTAFVGVAATKTFESNLTASIGADFHFLMSNYGYKMHFDSEWDGDKTTIDYWWDDSETSSFGDFEAAANYYLIALPVRIGYNLGKFTPNVGMEFGHRLNDNDVDKNGSLSFCAGAEYRLSPKFALTLNYVSNVTSDMSHTARKVKKTCTETEYGWVENVEKLDEQKINWHSQRLEIGVNYRLGKSE